ncbi:unnamed protein product [Gadus morhua 'NCC']
MEVSERPLCSSNAKTIRQTNPETLLSPSHLLLSSPVPSRCRGLQLLLLLLLLLQRRGSDVATPPLHHFR